MNQNLLENITAVEVSTVIVKEIIDEVFIPWEVYQDIYYLSPKSLEALRIVPSLSDRYLQLRRQLELAYCLLAIDPKSQLYNRSLVEGIKRDLPILSRKNEDWMSMATRLPEPIPHRRERNMHRVNRLLKNIQFVDVLRQLSKTKAALDRRNRVLRTSLHRDISELTYAQTSLQLDGKITNRYDRSILERNDRDLLLQLHQQSTATGEQQWRSLIQFMFSAIARR
jgi:hypothetical protein